MAYDCQTAYGSLDELVKTPRFNTAEDAMASCPFQFSVTSDGLTTNYSLSSSDIRTVHDTYFNWLLSRNIIGKETYDEYYEILRPKVKGKNVTKTIITTPCTLSKLEHIAHVIGDEGHWDSTVTVTENGIEISYQI